MLTKDLNSITSNTSTNIDGDSLYLFLKDNAVENKIILRITGNPILSSSFLNSSIGKFIDVFGLDVFRNNVSVSTSKNVYIQFKKYIDYYTNTVD
ncbi:MAG: hypothetical protein NXH90_04345 [Flavobacteriaceae bacterium]|nr:hypothetical protein [Flavobacteriaceae bacterium]